VSRPAHSHASARTAVQRTRAIAFVGLLCVLAVCRERTSPVTCEPIRAEAATSNEYAIKAAYIHNFARYVKWPDIAFKDADAPLYIAVLGQDPFGKVLDDTFKGKTSGTHPIEIKRFESMETLGDCHLLFVPSSEEKNLARLRESTKEKPILLVADSLSSAENGAHVGFYLEKSKVRFAINTESLKTSKLEASSELLKLARILEKRSQGGP
jgi:hypothetical protein